VQTAGETPGAVLHRLFDAVDAFVGGAEQHDDITAAVVRYSRL
jgi:serine phosphatase RsbU (regulator of sigma subunit)